MKVVIDQYVSPTLNTNLAEMLLEVVKRGLEGIYHLSGATPINRYDFALALAREFNLNMDLIMPARTDETEWTARRPSNTSLNVEKASKNLNRKPLKMEESLKILREEISLG